jgi:hypothetical protein
MTMGCCGRRELPYAVRAGAGASSGSSRLRQDSAARVEFEYTGRTRLVVIGPVTGLQYRFGGPGARALVHPRDQWSVERVPDLVRVEIDGAHGRRS